MTEIKDKVETDIFIDNKKPLFEVSKDSSDKENPVTWLVLTKIFQKIL